MTEQDYINAAIAAVADLRRMLQRNELGSSIEHLVNFFRALSVVARYAAERLEATSDATVPRREAN